MTAQYLTIKRKHRQFAAVLASLADFSCAPSDVVSPDIVPVSPTLSLYCLDDAERCAIFVELPVGVDLTRVPFVYQMQYDQAQRLLAVPYDTFRRLAHTLPAVERLIVIYSMGRSGSTLLSHLLNAVPSVVSLSEPDVATQFVHLRRTRGVGEAGETALRELLDCTVRCLFNPSAVGPKAAYALKLRAHGLRAMDLFQATFPRATHLFLYRDALGFVASFTRILRRFGAPENAPVGEALAQFGQYFDQDMAPLQAYLEEGTTALSLPQQFTLMWLAGMEWYLAQYAKGIPVLAVRYDDLAVQRERVLNAILAYCGLPPTQAPNILDVFAQDAQADTALARDNPEQGNQLRLSDEEQEAIARILRQHPVVTAPDFVAPGTLRV